MKQQEKFRACIPLFQAPPKYHLQLAKHKALTMNEMIQRPFMQIPFSSLEDFA
ncbi:hypothetical protein IC802_15770 [Geobacillus sp. 44C]|jgi:hypothetical protein|nr:hypothetical protein IC802_15770 [Geobacillus sp. 44C]